MIYEFVSFHEIGKELEKNFTTHYADMKRKEEYGPGDIDWFSYIQASHLGKCKVVTVREDGELIAYSVFFIFNNMNHRKIIEATNTGLFIKKEYRGKIILELLRKSDEFLQNYGVMETNYATNDTRIGKLLERVKYKTSNVTWSIKYGSFFNTTNSSCLS